MLTTLKVDSSDLKKITLKIRTAEGVQGNLLVYIIPKSDQSQDKLLQRDMCASMEIPLKPLNLHESIQIIPEELTNTLPFSKITIKGRFT